MYNINQREISEKYGVSRQTVAEAVKWVHKWATHDYVDKIDELVGVCNYLSMKNPSRKTLKERKLDPKKDE